ncbi:transcriptional regulator GlxA family with amidase domain [Nitrobacteraceae bacterium AZCC 2146]
MQRIGVVTFPGFHVMTFAAMSVFEVANSELGERRYDVHFLSQNGGPVRTSAGLMVETEPFDDSLFDTLIVGGSTEQSFSPSEGMLAFLRKALEISRRVAATCVGVFTLAEAGLLDGKRVTTHWDYARELQRRFPKVRVEEDRIFVIDGSVWTSAGMTATMDLVLAMVEGDIGPEVARTVAKKMVIHHKRAGGQSQFSALLQLEPKSDRIQTALAFARRNLHAKLTVEKLADVAHLSPRQFTRAFAAETGESPAKAIEKLRLEAARLMLEDSRHSIETIARQTGFADRERMRRAFVRAFGLPPQAMRRQARRDAQPACDVPSGSLPALRDADLVVTQEPATLQGDAPSFREFLAEHRQSALRLGPGRFVLQHIPMFGEDAVGDAHDVRSNPIFR